MRLIQWVAAAFSALALLVSLNLPAAHAAACPAGYTQVGGVQTTETSTEIINKTVCMADEDVAACKATQSQIDEMNYTGRRASLALDVYSFYDQPGGWQGKGWKAPAGFTLVSNDIDADRDLFPG